MLRISRVLVGVFLAACIGTIARGAPTPLELRFEEGSGTIAHDSSGSGNDAQVYGATWVPTPFGTGLRFDGVDDYVDISVLENFTTGTIEAWVLPAEFPRDGMEVISGLLVLDFGVGQDGGFYIMFSVSEALSSGTYLKVNRWYHLVATFDGALWSIYVNGERKNSLQSSSHFNAQAKFIGQYHGLGLWKWNGAIDEVRIDTRALSAEEIRARFQEDVARADWEGTSLGGPTPLELRFEEGSGTIAHDSSGSGNDAQVYGATWVPTPFGTGLRFDGVDDYVDISVLENFSEGTIEAWATTELTAADLPGDREIVSGVLAYDFGTRDGEFFVCFPADEGPFGLLSGVFPERNRLYHLAATFDGSTWNVYVDGELKNSHDSSYYFNWSRKYVGQYCELGPFNWAGTIDEVRIHTRALSAEEIRARYEEDVARRMPLFIRGHVNADAELDIADAIKMCSIMFAGEPTTCRDAIDANDDGELNLADVVCVLQEIFTWEHTMAEPYLTCGHDETEDTLDCASSPTCD